MNEEESEFEEQFETDTEDESNPQQTEPQQNQTRMAARETEFRTANAVNVCRFKYATLLGKRNATNASLANKSFTALNMMYESILGCIDTIDNTEGQVAIKNAAGVAKLNGVMEMWKNTLTKESEIEAFKKFLNGTDNLQLSADEQLVTIAPTVNQATEGGHEIPVLVGDRACLPKSTPEFFGLRKENVTEWLKINL